MTEKKKLPPGIREHHGSYQVRYYPPNGKEQTKSFRTITEAKAFKRAIETDKERGDFIDPHLARVPFSEYAVQWFNARARLGASKRKNNEAIMRRHIIGGDGFGDTPIGRITRTQVQAWVNALIARDYSPSYIRDAYVVLQGILRGAVSDGHIKRAPLDGIELPELVRRKQERFLNEVEIDRLVECFDPFYRPLIFTAAWTGLRWGELAGLQRASVDLDKRQLEVRNVLTPAGTMKGYPKNESGRRTIGLSASVVSLLTERLSEIEDADDAPVFPSRSGGLLHASNFRRRVWAPAVKQAGLTPLTFHDLRHSHASLLIHYGWQEFRIVKRMGWRDATMLHRVYGHLFPQHDSELVEAMEISLQDARVGKLRVVNL